MKRATGLGASAAKSAANASGSTARKPSPTGPTLLAAAVEIPHPSSGDRCAIAPGFEMFERAKRASHVDPQASSYAIMRRAGPYRVENPGLGKGVEGRA